MTGDPGPATAGDAADGDSEFEASVRSLVAPFLSAGGGSGGEPVRIERLSGGASRRTWTVSVPGRPGGFVLQVARGGATPMEWQARVMTAAARAGVRVPEVLSAGPDPGGLGGDHLLTTRVEGESIPPRILRDPALAGARTSLTAELGATLARIHGIDPGPGPETHGESDLPDELTTYRDVLAGLPTPYPALELAARWLERTRPEPLPPTLVHGDFRLGNLLVAPEGLTAVLDWELAHRGDPREDLGWLCVRAWRFGGGGRVAGLGSRAELLEAYRAMGGAHLEEADLDWWEALGAFRWGVICAVQGARHLSGAERSHELAAVGRRVCENEWDLLSVITPLSGAEGEAVNERARRALALTRDADRVPPALEGPGALHGGPDAGQLLHAVRHWLGGDLGPDLGGRNRFHARVAANILAQVERELLLAPDQTRERERRLARLGVADGAELARAIREGDPSLDPGEVLEVVRADVIDRLLVSNPRYLLPPTR